MIDREWAKVSCAIFETTLDRVTAILNSLHSSFVKDTTIAFFAGDD
jgi:hypothetical protein